VARLSSFSAMIVGQAAVIGILGKFKLMTIVILIVNPFALLLRKPRLAG
jgi:DHA2 family multidrug resistance protein